LPSRIWRLGHIRFLKRSWIGFFDAFHAFLFIRGYHPRTSSGFHGYFGDGRLLPVIWVSLISGIENWWLIRWFATVQSVFLRVLSSFRLGDM
jgi:hypothetical protein